MKVLNNYERKTSPGDKDRIMTEGIGGWADRRKSQTTNPILTQYSEGRNRGGLGAWAAPSSAVVLPSMVRTHYRERQVLQGSLRQHLVTQDTIPGVPAGQRMAKDDDEEKYLQNGQYVKSLFFNNFLYCWFVCDSKYVWMRVEMFLFLCGPGMNRDLPAGTDSSPTAALHRISYNRKSMSGLSINSN